MNTYELSRAWYDWSFENPEKVSPNHSAILFFAIEHCNRLGWKAKFGFPTQMVMDAIGIKKHQTYIKYFNDLVDFGFFELVQKSQNQYSANIISLKVAKPKNGKALDKAIINHTAKQTGINGQSNSSIDKQDNQLNQEQDNKGESPVFNFRNSLIEYGFKENLVSDWLKVRKTKKATNTEVAFNKFISQIEKSKFDKNEILTTCIEKSWSGFEAQWMINVQTTLQNGNAQPVHVKIPDNHYKQMRGRTS